jgi:hypothetical protein
MAINYSEGRYNPKTSGGSKWTDTYGSGKGSVRWRTFGCIHCSWVEYSDAKRILTKYDNIGYGTPTNLSLNLGMS